MSLSREYSPAKQPSHVRLQRIVGLIRIVNGVGRPSRSRNAVRLAEPRSIVLITKHSMKRSRARGLRLPTTCLAMCSAGWSAMILSRTKRISALCSSGVSFSARLKALTILALSSVVASLSIWLIVRRCTAV